MAEGSLDSRGSSLTHSTHTDKVTARALPMVTRGPSQMVTIGCLGVPFDVPDRTARLTGGRSGNDAVIVNAAARWWCKTDGVQHDAVSPYQYWHHGGPLRRERGWIRNGIASSSSGSMAPRSTSYDRLRPKGDCRPWAPYWRMAPAARFGRRPCPTASRPGHRALLV